MNASEMRKKTPAELKDELIKLRREQFNLRMAAAAGQPARPDQYGKVRRNLARVKTVLNELELEGKLVARIRQFDFGAKDVDTMVVTWPVDFLPS